MFASSFQACSRELWCVAAGVLGRRDSADDVLQEAAVIGLGKLDSFDPSTSFVAWMAQIVRYVALNHRRKVQRSRTTPVEQSTLDAQPAANANPHATLTRQGDVKRDQEMFDDAMLAALATLDATARECLLLRVVMDMPYKDVARIVGVPEGTAMSHVHRSRHALRAKLLESTGPAGGSQRRA
jgi:RNA polymerase sigma-70 factor (ECF subfamily)